MITSFFNLIRIICGLPNTFKEVVCETKSKIIYYLAILIGTDPPGEKRVLKGNHVEQIRFGKDELFPLTAFSVDLIIFSWPLHVTDYEGSRCCVFLLGFTGVKVVFYQFIRGNTFLTLPVSVITIHLHYVRVSHEIRRQGLTTAQNKDFFFKLIFCPYVNPQLPVKTGRSE